MPMKRSHLPSIFVLAATTMAAQGALVWQVGMPNDSWPVGDGGGPNATFVQEQGVINALPGSPTSPETNLLADNDYYFAGTYTSTIPSVVSMYGAYSPAGIVGANEEAAERAHAGGDLDLRYHFNLPESLAPDHQLSISWMASNLDTSGTNPRFGNELYFNGVLVMPQVIVVPANVPEPGPRTTFTTAWFSLASVNAVTGPGADNIVSLKGISYNADGGGNWMGVDYIKLDSQIPEPSTALMVLLGAMGFSPLLRRRRTAA
jgi:hypothetical protein